MSIVVEHSDFQFITEIENADLPSPAKIEDADLPRSSSKIQGTDLNSTVVREIGEPNLKDGRGRCIGGRSVVIHKTSFFFSLSCLY